jgi:hypothetical protein
MQPEVIMTREFYEWANFWWDDAPNTTSPRIMLIGDSITNGYKNIISDLMHKKGVLTDMAVSSHSVEDPAFFHMISYISGNIPGYSYKVIHFNNGLHGSHLTGAQFEAGMRKAIGLLRSLQPQAVLILAACTAVTPKGSEGTVDPEKNAYVMERNAIIARLAGEYGLPLDDLFAAVAAKTEYPQPDSVHYTEAGYRRLAEAAAESIMPYII